MIDDVQLGPAEILGHRTGQANRNDINVSIGLASIVFGVATGHPLMALYTNWRKQNEKLQLAH
jgi:hypothetical protein